MLIPILVLLVAIAMIAVELRQPGRNWPDVRGWWLRASLLNGFQAVAVGFAGWAWDGWMQAHRVWTLDHLGTVGGAVVGYLVLTFVYYWWHRARHEVGFLWRWFHQVHHAPQRLEIITSFYKHPFEILANAMISSVVMYLVVGLSAPAAAGATLIAGLAELFYHWNVRTPHWVGYLVQRPESHCVHHEEGIHHYNYGDLPIWDMLFGTFHNPKEFDRNCGFGEREHQLGEMLLGHDVHAPQTVPYRGRIVLLTLVGFLGMGASAVGHPKLKGLAAMTAASPAPKVFTSHNGLETFSTKFTLEFQDETGLHSVPLTPDLYGQLEGPYNRRNIFGAVLAYGPVLASTEATRPMFEQVTRYALCPDEGAVVLAELGISTQGVSEVGVRYAFRDGTAASYEDLLVADCKGAK